MNTLDRYIARQYLFNVIALLVLLFSFVVAVDVALNIDRFLQTIDRMSPGAGAVRRFALVAVGAVELWWPRLLQLYSYLIGLVLVAAMGFTFTQLVRHRELVAVLAGGISLYRVAVPVLIVAAVMLGLRVANQELVLSRPDIAPLLGREIGDIGKRRWKLFPVRLVADAQGRIFLAREFNPDAGVMSGLTVWMRNKAGIAPYAVHAEHATWRDGGWDLQSPSVQIIQPGATAPPAPARIESDLNPGALKFMRLKSYSQTLSWSQISEMLASPLVKPEMRENLQRIRWSRLSQVLCAGLALVITMPFFVLREPRNMLLQSLKCAPIGILALMGGILLSSVPWPVLPAGFAVFIPVLILAPLAIASVSWVRT